MKIAVIGASGWLGGTFAREALGRGQEVVAIGRDRAALESVEGALVAPADLDDPDSVLAAVSGSNVIVVAVTDRATPDRFRIPVTAAQLLDLAPAPGSGASFSLAAGQPAHRPGLRAMGAPAFPEHHPAEALAQAEALRILQEAGDAVDWTCLSPPRPTSSPGRRPAPTAPRRATTPSSTPTARRVSRSATSPRPSSTNWRTAATPDAGSPPGPDPGRPGRAGSGSRGRRRLPAPEAPAGSPPAPAP